MSRRLLKTTLLAAFALILAAAAAFLYWRHERAQADEQVALQRNGMVRDYSPVMGPKDAKVTIVEFFDPACEACRAFYPAVKQIMAGYPNDVRLVIRYAPFHREASVVGVRILEAARAQGRFEPVLEALLAGQPVWASHQAPAVDRAWEFAEHGGLDLGRAKAYLTANPVEGLLKQEMTDIETAGVRATPTFFVNGQRLEVNDPRALAQMVRQQVNAAK